MRFASFGLISTALFAGVIGNAWMQRGNTYASLIHITKNSGNMMVSFQFFVYLAVLMGRVLSRLFFGQLRASEIEHLYEKSWFAVTETALAMTIFRDEFDIKFVMLFLGLLGVKIFHWIVADRVDYMEQGPLPPWHFHVRMITLFLVLSFVDLLGLGYAVEHTLKHGPTMLIIFGFEYSILFINILATLIKYCLHLVDLRDRWDDKGMYIFYLELVVDFCKLLTYFVFFALVVHFYGLPLHIVRDLYFTLRSFIQRCKDLVRYRRATSNMDTRYPDATEEELRASDGICIICREEMVVGRRDADRAKKLPCNHLFHFHCLRSWLERQQSCPTCRRSVLVDIRPTPPTAPAGQAAAQPAQGVQPAQAAPAVQPGQAPPPTPATQLPQAQQPPQVPNQQGQMPIPPGAIPLFPQYPWPYNYPARPPSRPATPSTPAPFPFAWPWNTTENRDRRLPPGAIPVPQHLVPIIMDMIDPNNPTSPREASTENEEADRNRAMRELSRSLSRLSLNLSQSAEELSRLSNAFANSE